MSEAAPTVFIVDDDPSVRNGLARLVQAAGLRAESFDSAEAFLATGRGKNPGCVVLDLKMPGMTGTELQQRLEELDCRIPIIFLSAHGNVPAAAVAFKRGAVDFLVKPVDRDVLLAAIRTSLARDAQQRMSLAERESVSEKLRRLTTRERDVLRMVISGRLNKQIADELGIIEGTVKIHRARVMRKLEVESVAELTRLCMRGGVDPA